MCSYRIYIGPQNTCIGTTLRPKYLLFGYMDPEGLSGLWATSYDSGLGREASEDPRVHAVL